MSIKKIAVLVGSLRLESFTKKIAHQLMELAPDTLKLETVEIGDLPLYNQDLDEGVDGAAATPPTAWIEFRNTMKAFDGILFATPEYNRSVPAVLKNAIDVGSRPYGQSIWNAKPAAVVSCSPGAMGGFGANHHLRQSLVFLNVPTMPAPEVYLGGVSKLLDARGNLTNEDTKKFLKTFMNNFAKWVETNGPKL